MCGQSSTSNFAEGQVKQSSQPTARVDRDRKAKLDDSRTRVGAMKSELELLEKARIFETKRRPSALARSWREMG